MNRISYKNKKASKKSLQIKIDCQRKKYKDYVHLLNLKRFTRLVLQGEKHYNGNIGIIFASNNYIRQLNFQFFNRSEPTDVISFTLNEMNSEVPEGEIYVSVDQAQCQALEYRVSLNTEIQRLVIHGILHVLGYEDTTVAQKKKMKVREDHYISLLGDIAIFN